MLTGIKVFVRGMQQKIHGGFSIHSIFITIRNRFDICILGLVYYPIIKATDCEVIGGPNEVRMHSAKQNQDFKEVLQAYFVCLAQIKQSEQLAEI